MMKLLRRLFCRHQHVEVVRGIYGDEINIVGGKRWLCECRDCGAKVLR